MLTTTLWRLSGRLLVIILVAGAVPVPESRALADGKDGSLTSVTYEQGKNRTSVGFSEAQILADAAKKLLLTVSCGYEGKEPKKPEQCLVIFRVVRTDRAFCEDGSYVMTTDGKQMERQFKNYGCAPDGSQFIADLFALWPFADLSRVAASKQLSVNIRNLNVPVNDRVLQGIRDIRAHFQ